MFSMSIPNVTLPSPGPPPPLHPTLLLHLTPSPRLDLAPARLLLTRSLRWAQAALAADRCRALMVSPRELCVFGCVGVCERVRTFA